MIFIIAACTKTNMQPAQTALSSSSSEDLSAVSKASAVLTSHPWMYNAFYMHYIDKNHKGIRCTYAAHPITRMKF